MNQLITYIERLFKTLIRMNIKYIGLVIALITGHGYFRKHLAKVRAYEGNTNSRLCGQAMETAKHTLY